MSSYCGLRKRSIKNEFYTFSELVNTLIVV